MDYIELKSKLKEKIDSQKNKDKLDGKSLCEHQFKYFKQTLVADNPRFNRSAYFTVKACTVCKQKTFTDYKIE